MRLILVGTGPFGVPAFSRLYETGHQIVAVVTSPVRPVGRVRAGQQPTSPVRQLAEERATPVFDPENINSPEACRHLAELKCDLLVVCDYGQILSADALGSTRLGGVNLHGSLLPKYRGAAPIAWAIYHGETETGVSVIHMTPQVDAGPVIAQARVAIDPDETAGQLEQRLAQLGAPLLCEAIEQLAAGTATPIEQAPALASKAPRLKKSDGLIDWSRTASEIKNHVRAMNPWPKTYTYWHRGRKGPVRIIVERVRPLENHPLKEPGIVVRCENGELAVSCKDGAVAIELLQPAGKRLMSAEEFLRGYPIQVGDRLGPQSLPKSH